MNKQELFDIWIPDGTLWSDWGKPVLFAEMDVKRPYGSPVARELPPSLDLWAINRRTAIVADLRGADSVVLGLEMARRGFRPVPLFNASSGNLQIIDLQPIKQVLLQGADELRAFRLPVDAPPVFLLDCRRQEPGQTLAPGRFDNRWLVFPQDFPSANFLLSHGISDALLVQEGWGQPAKDLAHVLRRWQEAGIRMQVVSSRGEHSRPAPLDVRKPSHFRALWHRSLAAIGLRKNSAGGFGAVIPDAGGGGGGFG